MKTYDFDGAVKYLQTSPTTLNELLVNAVIAGAKIGQSWCLTEENLDAYIRAETERQTLERLECIRNGVKPRAVTARGRLRTVKPDLDKMAA